MVIERQSHDLFHSFVPPPKAPLRRDSQSPQLANLDLFADLCFNQLAHAGFPDAARACHKKKHSHLRLMQTLVGGNKEIRRRLKLIRAFLLDTLSCIKIETFREMEISGSSGIPVFAGFRESDAWWDSSFGSSARPGSRP